MLSYADIRLALEAIVYANATDEAYEVAAIFGWHELFPGTIYREEIWMEITTAREIIKRAKADEMYEAPMPEDDATCIKEAQGLVEMAEQAWAQHIRGKEVEAILKIAAGAANSDEPAEPEESVTEEVIAEASPEGPPSALLDVADKLKQDEPWEGYAEARVVDVTEGLNWYQQELSSEEYLDILKHVHAYESTHKSRSRILEFVVESWSRSGGALDEKAEEPAEEPAEAEEPEQEPEPEVEEPEAAEPESDEPESEQLADEPVAERDERESEEASTLVEERPTGQQGAYKKLIEIVDRELRNERLDGIPEPPSDEVPELPWKWADISDTDLQNFHGQYASMAYYKGYIRSRDERIAMHCKEAADELHNALLIKAPKYDAKGKEIRVTVMEAEISADPNVKRWRKLQRKHEAMTAQARAEQDSYLKLVEALSRLETMRQDVWERSKR